MTKRTQASFEILDRGLPTIQAKIVRRIQARIDEGAVVASIEDGMVVKKHRKKALVTA